MVLLLISLEYFFFFFSFFPPRFVHHALFRLLFSYQIYKTLVFCWPFQHAQSSSRNRHWPHPNCLFTGALGECAIYYIEQSLSPGIFSVSGRATLFPGLLLPLFFVRLSPYSLIRYRCHRARERERKKNVCVAGNNRRHELVPTALPNQATEPDQPTSPAFSFTGPVGLVRLLL